MKHITLLVAALTFASAANADDPMQRSGKVKLGEPSQLAESFGEGPYCIVNITNRSSHVMKYTTQWWAGDEKTKKFTLEPGWCYWHTYDCSDEEPQIRLHFKVRYNYRPVEGTGYKNQWVISGRSEHQTCEDGPKWAFKDAGKNKIDWVQVREEPPAPLLD